MPLISRLDTASNELTAEDARKLRASYSAIAKYRAEIFQAIRECASHSREWLESEDLPPGAKYIFNEMFTQPSGSIAHLKRDLERAGFKVAEVNTVVGFRKRVIAWEGRYYK